MYSKLYKIIGIFLLTAFIGLVSPPLIKACTYQATITDKHVDFKITSDTNNIQFVQFMNKFDNSGAPFIVTSLSGPGDGWTQYSDGNQIYFDKSMVIQNRKQFADAAYWVSWVDSQHYNIIPSGIYGLNFSGSMSYEDISFEYGTMDSGGNFNVSGNDWQFCTRIGNVGDPTPTPISTPSPTPTEIPLPTASSTPTPTILPTLLPTSSPIPTPSPSNTPVPVKKVILIPGLGASWNVDALMNCKNTGYSGEWTLAPYAKGFYKEILNQLPDHNWGTYPFYYDWRQDVRTNATKLTNLININTTSGEKINIVGHSMGGLIGRNYLETQSGGRASKFLAVGAPFQGSAFSYPTLFGGQVWTNSALDLPQKIATTLQLNHCGIPESLQNLLPTYNYLRDNNTKQIINTATLKVKNNYLPTDFVSPFWGVKVGTLAGAGESTLKIIDVISDSKWPNGKPVGREYVNEGDGTVLLSSAQIPGAHSNQTIYESHTGIIASTEGVNKILEFLGSPGITEPPYKDPKSALILVGYPGTFWIKDINGKTTQSEQGMIALLDPKDGDYQLQIVPQSTDTKFIAAQFLGNGKTLYKEYKFKGLVQEPKVVHFDSNHPTEDVIHNIKEFQKPLFPLFWLEFWRFWNKLH